MILKNQVIHNNLTSELRACCCCCCCCIISEMTWCSSII